MVQHPRPPPADMSHHRDSLTRLFTSLRRLSHLRGPLEWIDAPSTTTDALDQFGPLEIDIDPDTLRVHSFDLVLRLQESLPADCKWLDEATIQVDGEFPKAAGGTANVWVGIMGVRKVAIKSYRCYSSSDWLPNYVVSYTRLSSHVLCRLKVYQQRFYKEALACSHLRHHNIVSFIGMYSTPEHPLALVFDFMDHNLGAFLGSNKNARRLELVRSHPVASAIHDFTIPRPVVRHSTRCGIYAQTESNSRGHHDRMSLLPSAT